MKVRVLHRPEATYIEPQLRRHAGDPASKKIKAVCKDCNSSWMSRIEEAAKPILTPMFLGEASVLTPADQSAITECVALKTIVGEFDDTPDTRAIDAETRQAFFERRELLGVWKIWLGNYRGAGAWNTRYRHAPGMVYLKSSPVIDVPVTNSQVSAFAGGKLFILAFNSRVFQTEAFGFGGAAGEMLRSVFPATGETIVWPPIRPISDDAADIISNALSFWPGAPGFKIS